MRLLDNSALVRSEVVANAAMNRARKLTGPNSYEQDLGLSPLAFLKKALKEQESVSWLDLCCGTGRALIQAAAAVQDEGLNGRVSLTGVDLIPMFDTAPSKFDSLSLIVAQADQWKADEKFDLVTCVHGLHYIGDKLGVLQKAAGLLKAGGLLLMHLDYQNLRVKGHDRAARQIGKDLSRAGFRYISGRHLLVCEKQTSKWLPYRYLGANDDAGPNYTGQPAVDSYYERLTSR